MTSEGHETDVTDSIVCVWRFGIPLTSTHKIAYRYGPGEYVLTCKICDGIMWGWNPYTKDIKGISESVRDKEHDVFTHLLKHRFAFVGPNLNSIRDNYCYDQTDIYFILKKLHNTQMERRFLKVLIKLTPIIYRFKQLLMIVPLDSYNDVFCRTVVKNNDEMIEMGVAANGHKLYGFCDYSKFAVEFEQYMIRCDFKCLFCGEYYDSGLPTMEMVVIHIKKCIPQFRNWEVQQVNPIPVELFNY